jgi:hypothetical protein
MKQNQPYMTARLIVIAVSCLGLCAPSVFAAEDMNSAVLTPQGRVPTINFDPNDARCVSDITCLSVTTLFNNFANIPSEQQSQTLLIIDAFRPWWLTQQLDPSSTLLPFSTGLPRFKQGDDRRSIMFNYGESPIIKDLNNARNVDKLNLNDYDESLLAQWEKMDELLEEWEKKMQELFSANWEDQERIANALDKQWHEKINELINGIQKHPTFVNTDQSDIVILDAVDFTNQIKAIHRLLNPPTRLHPWLKWLLYLSRVSPEMLQLYQAALEGRDRIYTLASKSDGRLKIRYQGRIMDVPIFVWPDDAEGYYELVMVRDQHAIISSHSSASVAQAGSGLPSQ